MSEQDKTSPTSYNGKNKAQDLSNTVIAEIEEIIEEIKLAGYGENEYLDDVIPNAVFCRRILRVMDDEMGVMKVEDRHGKQGHEWRIASLNLAEALRQSREEE